MKKLKKFLKTALPLAFYLIIGGMAGFFSAQYLDSSAEGFSVGQFLFAIALAYVQLMAAYLLQIIIHESGHLIFGLATGYRFRSFRIFSLTLLRTEKGLAFRRYSLAGTAGQCLLSPPDWSEKGIPFVMYNLGGAALNLISAAIFVLMAWLLPVSGATNFLCILAAFGLVTALMNGIPMRTDMVDNDGYNVLSLRRDRRALYSLWVQMKINDQQVLGARLRDMPAEWFALPEKEAMNNSMVAAQGVLHCNRLLDEGRFEETAQAIDALLKSGAAIVNLHRRLLLCDRIYLELTGENRTVQVDSWLDKKQVRFMKAMKSYPSVLRTEYALALLHRKEPEQAAKILTQFDQTTRSYPFPGEIESERELIDRVDADR